MQNILKKYSEYSFIIFILLIGLTGLATLFIFPLITSSQTNQEPITGYAWSDTIGWISLNCINLGICDSNQYGINIDSSGQLSGYAWSDNIGWISANEGEVTGCPNAPCKPHMQDDELHGWLRALSPVGASESEHGGWDGWISLNGDGYGVRADNGIFSGFAWGNEVIGWVNFYLARSNYRPCSTEYFCTNDDQYYRDQYCKETLIHSCSPLICSSGACIPAPATLGTITIIPKLVNIGDTVVVSWLVQNAKSCTITGNGNSWTGLSGEKTSNPILAPTTYTLSCIELDDDIFIRSVTVSSTPLWREI